MNWDHKIVEEFHQVLLHSFNQTSLAQMIRFQLGKDIHHFIPTSSTYSLMVFELLEVAQREGWLLELLDAAHKHNPQNKRLSLFVEKVKINRNRYIQPGSTCSTVSNLDTKLTKIEKTEIKLFGILIFSWQTEQHDTR